MKVQRHPDLKIRSEDFGGVVYVPQRDDFFLLNDAVFSFLRGIGSDWKAVEPAHQSSVKVLASLGICRTRDPITPESSYSGVGLLGRFSKLPSVREPLVINCFATSFCPLKCMYCHADDLMGPFRDSEDWKGLERVANKARLIPSIVAVITGGDPLTRPNRALYLMEALAGEKALVLDTSGVGSIPHLLRYLREYKVHVRVSLDIFGIDNKHVRVSNRMFTEDKDASYRGAIRSIQSCLDGGIAVSVQTVVSSYNDRFSYLRDLRDFLIDLGVRHWVLHVAVAAGKARVIQNRIREKHLRRGGILPRPAVRHDIGRLIAETQSNSLPIDIRVTNTNRFPHSVILIGSTGEVYTEGRQMQGKASLHSAQETDVFFQDQVWNGIHKLGHVQRYINWSQPTNRKLSVAERCAKIRLQS